MRRIIFQFLLPCAVIFSACKKDDPVVTPVAPAITGGTYVLSEGGFGANNAKLAFRADSSGSVTGDFFLQQNPTITAGLGDLGNDAIVYGGKLYIVMNGSNNVTVLNARSGTYVNSISFIAGPVNKSPRYALGHNGRVYVTAFDGTVSVIDTSSLSIINTIQVGPNPEGLAAVGNYLYVANSGGLNAVPDSTVSVVNLTTNLEVQRITVCVNPQVVAVNSAGKVYVSGFGNFSTIPAAISVINSNNNTLEATLGSEFAYDHIRINNDTAYLYNNYGGAGTCKVMNTINNTVIRNEFITDGTAIAVPYGLNINSDNGDVYIADAGNFTSAGTVTCFGSNGQKKFSFSVAPGVNPNKIVFVN